MSHPHTHTPAVWYWSCVVCVCMCSGSFKSAPCLDFASGDVCVRVRVGVVAMAHQNPTKGAQGVCYMEHGCFQCRSIPPRFWHFESRARVPPRQGRGKTAAAGSREPNWHRPVRPKGSIELRAVAIGMHVELEQDRVLKFSEAMVRFCYLRSFSTRSSSTGSTGFRVRRHERARRRDAPLIVRLEDRSETILDPLKHGRTVVVSATPL
jgi:hypothetical protein